MPPSELFKKIRMIEIHSARLVDHQLAGRYHSIFKGRGIAFSEVRPYTEADDFRSIDWNVSARMNAPHVKIYTEERDRTVMLMIDMSGSGRFGSGVADKRTIAAEVAALVAFSAIKNNDRVGLIIFTDRVERFVPPRKGQRHVLRVIREILGYRPRSVHTSVRVALDYFARVSRRRAVAFLISDFLDAGWERPLKIASRRNDIVPVIITDPMEERLPGLGLLTLEDVETGEVFEFDSSGPEADAYARLVERRRERREAFLRRNKIDFVDIRTDRPYIDALIAFFRARARRMYGR